MATPTTGTQRRGKQRRESILEASIDILLAQGVSAVTHRGVCSQLDVPHASVRYYFTTREDLLLACLGRIEERRSDSAEKHIERFGLSEHTDELFADAAVHCLFGEDISDAGLRGMAGVLVDCARLNGSLADYLRAQRPTIDAQFDRLLTIGGLPTEQSTIVTAIIDGVVLSRVAEGREDIRSLCVELVASFRRWFLDSQR